MLSIGALVDPAVKTVVAPNVDTTYTVAQLNLAAGPLVIDVPDTRGRYYVLQLLDAYSNTFGYVGRRTTGTHTGSFALVPPAFGGALPPGVRRITSPTPLVWLLGRTLVRGAADLPSVTDLMRAYRVTPLAEWTAGARQPPLVLPAFPPNQTRLVLPKGLAFFDALGAHLAANPPPARDACALRVFAGAGIGAGRTPSSYSHGAVRRGLARGAAMAERPATARDGSLTLYVQRRAPSGRRRANWLPGPRGRLRLIMRLYEPRRRALSGDWRPPPVRRHRGRRPV